MSTALYIVAAWLVLGALGTICGVGRERKPLAAGVAAYSVIFSAAAVVVVVLAARRMT